MSDAELLEQAIESGAGWYAVAAAVVVLLVRAYRARAVQALLPRSMQWALWPRGWRLAIVFVVALLSAWVAALVAGQGIVEALVASLPVAVTAVLGHKASKAAGHAHTHAKLRGDLGYQPSALRNAVSPVFPVDARAVASAQRMTQRVH